MIKNEKQYQITKKRLKEFQESLTAVENTDMDELNRELHEGALKSQIDELTQEIREYELLKKQEATHIITSFVDFPEALIKGRIAHGWTQADLAQKIGMREQQIQRYEACNYSTACFPRLITIAETMGLEIGEVKTRIKKSEFIVEGVDPLFLKRAKEKLRIKRTLFSI